MMGINGRGRKGWRPLQNGLKQPLFCEDCEQLFNEHYEKPFRRQWIESPTLPAHWPEREPVWIDVDYKSFKLFHFSVLFRASVSNLPTFAEVELGPHEEKIRQRILMKDPGPSSAYPIMGIALYDRNTRELNHTVTMPVATRFEELRCYAIAYGGAQWWTAVSAHVNERWLSSSVTTSGHLPMVGLPWTELGLVQQGARMLPKRENGEKGQGSIFPLAPRT